MTKMFGDLRKDDQMEAPTDRVGGGYQPVESGVYDGVIKLAYAGKARSSEAQNVTLHIDVNGRELRQTIYVTTKKGENFFIDKDTKKEVPLPGYTTVNDICLLTTGHPLTEQDCEMKTLKLYNFEEKKELPTEVPVLTGLLNQPIKLGILRVIDDKNTQGADGVWRASGETKTINEIDKAFHAESGRIVSEFRREIMTPDFLEVWKKANDGQDRNKAKGAGKGAAGASGSGKPAAGGGGAPAPSSSLFGS